MKVFLLIVAVIFFTGCSTKDNNIPLLDFKVALTQDDREYNDEVLYAQVAKRLYRNSMFLQCDRNISSRNKVCVDFHTRNITFNSTVKAVYRSVHDTNATIESEFVAVVEPCSMQRCQHVIVGRRIESQSMIARNNNETEKIDMSDLEDIEDNDALSKSDFSQREIELIDIDSRTLHDKYTPYRFLEEVRYDD